MPGLPPWEAPRAPLKFLFKTEHEAGNAAEHVLLQNGGEGGKVVDDPFAGQWSEQWLLDLALSRAPLKVRGVVRILRGVMREKSERPRDNLIAMGTLGQTDDFEVLTKWSGSG